MSGNYSVNLRRGDPHDVNKADFDRLRKMPMLFNWKPNRPKRLTLKPEYIGWMEGREFRFQEKLTKRITRYVPSPEDSCVATERRCAVHDRRYIRDDNERQREVAKQYS